MKVIWYFSGGHFVYLCRLTVTTMHQMQLIMEAVMLHMATTVILQVILLIISCGAQNRDNNHGEEFHVKCLHQMCRICSKLITRNTRYYSVNKYAKDLAEAFGVNFNADKSELQPPRFCFTCEVS